MPDLILCDISMRVMSGFEVLENLTSIAPRFGNMPFVFLTALTDRNSELKGRRLGADDYVTKPIDFDVLVAIITARLTNVARTDIWAREVQLNDREAETLTWVARGKTSVEIAQFWRCPSEPSIFISTMHATSSASRHGPRRPSRP